MTDVNDVKVKDRQPTEACLAMVNKAIAALAEEIGHEVSAQLAFAKQVSAYLNAVRMVKAEGSFAYNADDDKAFSAAWYDRAAASQSKRVNGLSKDALKMRLSRVRAGAKKATALGIDRDDLTALSAIRQERGEATKADKPEAPSGQTMTEQQLVQSLARDETGSAGKVLDVPLAGE